MKFTKEELEKALSLISSTINNCENMQDRFPKGTSQHTLLKTRIKALYISKELISGNKSIKYTSIELREALAPVISIINKTTKAQSKYEKGSSQYNRFEPLIKTMFIAKTFIENQLNNGSDI